MENITFVFIDQIFTSSGVETYIYRMSYWLIKHGYNVILMLPENCRKIDNKLLEQTKKIGVDIRFNLPTFGQDEALPNFKIKLGLKEASEVIILSTTILDLYIAEAIIYSNSKCRFTNISYMLHPKAFVINKYDRFSKLCMINTYKKISKRLIDNHILHFLSEEHKKAFLSENNYENVENRILRLGMFINEYDYSIISKKSTLKKNILTITRFDFPFKDYLKGLIESLKSIKNQDVTLTIIGWGEGENELISIIKKQPLDIQNRIIILKGVSYFELSNYFNDTYLYIGEGTSILDSLNSSTLSIVVNEYDEDCHTDGYFSQNYNVTTTNCTKYKIVDFLDRALSLSNEEYISQFNDDYIRFKDTYDIEIIMNQLLSIKNTDIHSITKFQIYKFIIQKRFFNFVKKLIRRKQ